MPLPFPIMCVIGSTYQVDIINSVETWTQSGTAMLLPVARPAYLPCIAAFGGVSRRYPENTYNSVSFSEGTAAMGSRQSKSDNMHAWRLTVYVRSYSINCTLLYYFEYTNNIRTDTPLIRCGMG